MSEMTSLLFLVLRTTNLFGGRSSENEMELIYQLLAERSFGQPRGEPPKAQQADRLSPTSTNTKSGILPLS